MLTCRVPYANLSAAQIEGAAGYWGLQPDKVKAPLAVKALISCCMNINPERRSSLEQIIQHLPLLSDVANSSSEDALISFMNGS